MQARRILFRKLWAASFAIIAPDKAMFDSILAFSLRVFTFSAVAEGARIKLDGVHARLFHASIAWFSKFE